MGKETEPQLIDRKILRKLLAKNYKNKHFSQKMLVDMKRFVIKNWYYLLIVLNAWNTYTRLVGD